MSEREPLRGADDVHGHIRRICFKTGPPGRVGAELEWIVVTAADPAAVVPLATVRALLDEAGAPPGRSAVTLEPGGQVELSSPPAPDLAGCVALLAGDLAFLRSVLEPAGLSLVPRATDPVRPPTRHLRAPRYDAMASYFSGLPTTLGDLMMCSTASVQVNLDAGADTADVAARWDLLHLVGPALSAAFANSPVLGGRRTGWRSTRQAVWLQLDPSRTAPPRGSDPAEAWAEYALDAPVMMRRRRGRPWVAAPGHSFRAWVEGHVAGAPPTSDDLDYHLTTLFPPVRPRGWFEVRYLDAQGPAWWPVPVAVLATLLDRPGLTDELTDACAPTRGRWLAAAARGLHDPALAHAARSVFAAVLPHIDDPLVAERVGEFADRYPRQGLCPADDDPTEEAPALMSAHPSLALSEETR